MKGTEKMEKGFRPVGMWVNRTSDCRFFLASDITIYLWFMAFDSAFAGCEGKMTKNWEFFTLEALICGIESRSQWNWRVLLLIRFVGFFSMRTFINFLPIMTLSLLSRHFRFKIILHWIFISRKTHFKHTGRFQEKLVRKRSPNVV